jgi:hypothetical protein
MTNARLTRVAVGALAAYALQVGGPHLSIVGQCTNRPGTIHPGSWQQGPVTQSAVRPDPTEFVFPTPEQGLSSRQGILDLSPSSDSK